MYAPPLEHISASADYVLTHDDIVRDDPEWWAARGREQEALREQNAHLKSTERQRGRGVEQVAISPPLGKSCDKKRRNDPSRHMRKLVYQERMDALRTALEGLLIAKGMTVTDAQNAVTKWVSSCHGRRTAKAVAERYGFNYLRAEWECVL